MRRSYTRRLFGVLKYIWSSLYSTLDPLGYARSIGVHLGDDVHFYGMKPYMFSTEPWLIRIGDDVHITSGCQFITHDGGTLVLRKREPTLEITAPIILGDRVYVGMNTMIMPGVTIGSDVVVGAGSVVTRDVPSGSVVAGVPAREIKTIDEYFTSLAHRSLGFGALPPEEKARALRRHFAGFSEDSSILDQLGHD
jgi:acetyltransferase-like isoleucine patch superfamily enzyme